ncbi:hypothetical protein KDW_06230 [Dictyobacter vulcani]|uniref:Uncharacterized protein n=1 Tax=Dictyobacter vulcani TaxID=2607529 RepID=A0A5J4KJX4_9CHLR|nr:hypothetical protein [Dictyobacter vulcani]GER86461.1 hypothetical protein KDW_06230 [Dictyobacter vulcani]
MLKVKERVDTLQGTLSKITVIIKALDKIAPMIDKKSEISTARNILSTVTTTIKTVENILNVATTNIHTVQRVLDKLMSIASQQAEAAQTIEADKQPSGLIAPPDQEATNNQKPDATVTQPDQEVTDNKEPATTVTQPDQEVTDDQKPSATVAQPDQKTKDDKKTVNEVDRPAQQVKEKTTDEVAQPDQETGSDQTKDQDAEIEQEDNPEGNMLGSLKNASIINPDAQSMQQKIEKSRSELPPDSGIVSYPGHVFLVLKEK